MSHETIIRVGLRDMGKYDLSHKNNLLCLEEILCTLTLPATILVGIKHIFSFYFAGLEKHFFGSPK